ncbi:hypothetical protein JQ631_12445 [Bradyrhizobium manausense]|uniref:hypothetical protein n=1 Tax=Bradyrhizobium manausense TaxID=989370 RepID=UPI001BAB0616|nr:hypothetical protein [Bradyrhizobium manausense]MBR0789886.1 hypothetical protein [Bradyrhizobium manausense]
MTLDVVEIIKFVGGVAGLCTAGFLIYDRLVRSRPITYLGVSDYKADLRLRNVTKETVIIDEISITPKDFLRAARANDLITKNEERQKAFYPTTAGKDDARFLGEFVILKPDEERRFSLHRFASFEHAKDDEKLVIRCRWENTRTPWFTKRYVKVRTTVGRVKKLVDAAAAGKV